MKIANLLAPDRVIAGFQPADKAQLLGELSRRAGALLQLPPQSILQPLQARETLGSTGLGRSFALPHASVEGIGALFGLFMRLDRPIDFQAIDDKPIDLVFVLLFPAAVAGERIAALAAISRKFRDEAFVARLRKTKTTPALYHLLVADKSDP